MDSALVSSVVKAREVLLSQLSEQGYDVSAYMGYSVQQVNAMVKNETLDFEVEKLLGGKAYIKFMINKQPRPNTLNELVERMFVVEEVLSKSDALYIISGSEANDTLSKAIENLWIKEGIYVNVISLSRLQFNLLDHIYVPKHKALDEEGKKKVYEQYNIVKDKELPQISRFDPVAVAIGLRPGQLCAITRVSPTALSHVHYRLCTVY